MLFRSACDLVGVADRGHPGTDVDELGDALPRQIPDRAAREQAVRHRDRTHLREVVQHGLAEFAVYRPVGVSTEVEVINPGDIGPVQIAGGRGWLGFGRTHVGDPFQGRLSRWRIIARPPMARKPIGREFRTGAGRAVVRSD